VLVVSTELPLLVNHPIWSELGKYRAQSLVEVVPAQKINCCAPNFDLLTQALNDQTFWLVGVLKVRFKYAVSAELNRKLRSML
jgi:hypothetical protein